LILSFHPILFSGFRYKLEAAGMKIISQTDILTFCVTVRSLRTWVGTSLYLTTSLVLVVG
jgi:hypothetical protein